MVVRPCGYGWDQGVLVITVHNDPGIEGRALLGPGFRQQDRV